MWFVICDNVAHFFRVEVSSLSCPPRDRVLTKIRIKLAACFFLVVVCGVSFTLQQIAGTVDLGGSKHGCTGVLSHLFLRTKEILYRYRQMYQKRGGVAARRPLCRMNVGSKGGWDS